MLKASRTLDSPAGSQASDESGASGCLAQASANATSRDATRAAVAGVTASLRYSTPRCSLLASSATASASASQASPAATALVCGRGCRSPSRKPASAALQLSPSGTRALRPRQRTIRAPASPQWRPQATAQSAAHAPSPGPPSRSASVSMLPTSQRPQEDAGAQVTASTGHSSGRRPVSITCAAPMLPGPRSGGGDAAPR